MQNKTEKESIAEEIKTTPKTKEKTKLQPKNRFSVGGYIYQVERVFSNGKLIKIKKAGLDIKDVETKNTQHLRPGWAFELLGYKYKVVRTELANTKLVIKRLD